MNKADVVQVLRTVRGHWPNFHVAEDRASLAAQAEAWWSVLADLELPVVLAALTALDVAGREFPPTPGQVRAEATPGAPDVDQALAEIFQQISRVGYVGTPTFSHPAIFDAVNAAGGWLEVCASENPEAMRAHLRAYYESAARRATRNTVVGIGPAVTFAELEAAVPVRAVGEDT